MEEEKYQLTELQKTDGNSVVRERSFCLLFSDSNHSMKTISQIVNVCLETVSRLFDVWELATAENKLSTPGIASGRGAKVLNLVGYKYDIKFY